MSFACKFYEITKLSFFRTRISDLKTLTNNQNGRPYQAENTEISPNFLVWKFMERHGLRRVLRRKLGEISEFYAVISDRI